jgi:uncharacterized membrane protein YraQ (UPF0718 family)
MVLAIVIAIASVAAGAALGMWRREPDVAAGPVHTFALVAALVVVLTQLLPESLAALGFVAAPVFAAGLLLPSLLERLTSRWLGADALPHDHHHPGGHHHPHGGHNVIGLEVGYLGLLVHKVGDGLALGAYSSEAHSGHGHLDILLAIGAHSLPVTALMVLAYKDERNTGVAIRRAIGLAVAAAAGIAMAGMVPTAWVLRVEPWVSAAVGGLLLHVVMHGWCPDRPPTTSSRMLDLLAIVASIGLVMAGGHSHHHGAEGVDVRHNAFHALIDLTLETAPALLLGLLVAALIQTFGSRIPARWLRSGSSLRLAVRGAVIGAPLPMCACGILPVAHSLRARGGAAALVVAFLLSTPELGIETFALTVRFLGWPFAIVRLVAAVLVAIVGAMALALALGKDNNDTEPQSVMPFAEEPGSDRPLALRLLAHFEELLYHVGPWTVVGLIAAAYLQAVLPDGAMGGMSELGLDVIVITAVAVPSYVCAASATPLAAVLLAKGLSPGAVLAGLLLGPATNIATVGWLRRSFGTRATAWGIGALVVATWLLAFGLNLAPVDWKQNAASAGAHEHGLFSQLAAGALGLLVLRSVWRDGLRAWLGSLGESLVGADAMHEHAHDAHSHAHEH